MISAEQEAEILRVFHAEKWKVGTIACQLHVHHDTVKRVLTQAGQAPALSSARSSIVDPYVGLIEQTLEKYPTLRASRLYQMARARGYRGGPDHFRHVVARYRPAPKAEAYLRLRTLPGEQAQVDWGYFGKFAIGRAIRPLWAFVMVLSYSRQLFVRFYPGQQMAYFLAGHVGAFEAFGGVPRVLLYDNLKSAVLERWGQAIRFNSTLLELAAHYRFEPRPVAVARGNEKGRVERAIRYLRTSFFPARTFSDHRDLSAQAELWANTEAADRPCPEERSKTVRAVLGEEKAHLLALPDNPFPCQERVETTVARTPYVRFDLNDYSVPHTYVRRPVVIYASLDTVRISYATTVIATHARSLSKGEQIECPEHIAQLVARKRQARTGRGLDRLHHLKHAQPFLIALAQCGGQLSRTISGLNELLDLYGAELLDRALHQAHAADALHVAAVRQLCEQARHAQHQAPPIAVALPATQPQLRELVVRPHALADYDHIETNPSPTESSPHDDDKSSTD